MADFGLLESFKVTRTNVGRGTKARCDRTAFRYWLQSLKTSMRYVSEVGTFTAQACQYKWR